MWRQQYERSKMEVYPAFCGDTEILRKNGRGRSGGVRPEFVQMSTWTHGSCLPDTERN